MDWILLEWKNKGQTLLTSHFFCSFDSAYWCFSNLNIFYRKSKLIRTIIFQKKHQKQWLLINEPTDEEKFGFRLYNVKQNCSLGSFEQLCLICCMYENHSIKSYSPKLLLNFRPFAFWDRSRFETHWNIIEKNRW